MAQKISRRKLASYTTDSLVAGDKNAVDRLAAYLVTKGRTNEAQLIVRDIQTTLSKRGVVVATVTSARPLEDVARQDIASFIKAEYGATTVELNEQIDETLIGGMRLELPDAQLDASVKTKLEKLTV